MNMTFHSMLELEGMMAVLMAVGYLVYRRGIVTEKGKQSLVNLCIAFIIPCNIIQAFCKEPEIGTLGQLGRIFFISVTAHLFCVLAGRFLFGRYPKAKRSVLQYATVCSNGGFMGNAVAEGLFGTSGLVYASIFLIPMRIVMWGFGPGYFSGGQSAKETTRKILCHPCMIGVYTGLLLMITGVRPPVFLYTVIQKAGNCTVPMTMMVVGMILAQEKLGNLLSATTLYFSLVRLGILPLVVLLLCRVFGCLDPISSGVCVIMMGLPAATMTPIMADRYGGDAVLASRCLVLTTGLSLATLTAWGVLLL